MSINTLKFVAPNLTCGVAWMMALGSVLVGAAARAEAAPGSPGPETKGRQELARLILKNPDLPAVLNQARELLKTGFNAGAGYGEVWIRDLATFIELSCDVIDRDAIRTNLLTFFRFQGEDGNIIDGFIPTERAHVNYAYIRKASIPGFVGHKNTVETDQESSLVHAVHTYVQKTGDRSLLGEVVEGRTVLERLELALEFLLNHRFAKEYGLLWGATTADWGDVQPEHEWGVILDENSHRAIDIYDNAMFVMALSNWIDLVDRDAPRAERWRKVLRSIRLNIRTHLWDSQDGKFIPHIYLEQGSPFPPDFQEKQIFYHGGTTVAMLAGLLSPDEIKASLDRMVQNVRQSGAPSIGLTLYPPYPAGFFKNKSMGPYSYQNGGDWTWFGGRTIQALIQHGFIEEAYREIQPMLARVLKNKGFFEWYRLDGKPAGSATFRGSAGVLGKAITMLLAWAQAESANPPGPNPTPPE